MSDDEEGFLNGAIPMIVATSNGTRVVHVPTAHRFVWKETPEVAKRKAAVVAYYQVRAHEQKYHQS
jgi:hypothetical protein